MIFFVDNDCNHCLSICVLTKEVTMFELIEPAYTDADSDTRLVSLTAEMMRVASEINDAKWEGKDATALELRWSQLNKAYMDGAVYHPEF